MSLFDLDKQQIEVLFLRSKDLTPTQIQQRLHISSSEFFQRQNSAFTKLEIPGESKEKWSNFEKSGPIDILAKLTEDDIKNWNERREELRKRFEPPPRRTLPTPLLYGVVVLAVLAIGIWLGRFFFSPPENPLATPSLDSHSSPIPTEFSPPLSATAVLASPTTEIPTVALTNTSAPTITATLTPLPTETISPIGLRIGNELRDDRVTLKLIDVRWNEGYDRVSNLGRAPVSHIFEYTNHSGETIVVQFDKSYFVVEDNTGRTAECWFFLSPYAAFEEWNSTLNDNQTVLITTRCGNGQIPEGVTSYTLTIHPFTSLPESTWIVEVPR